MSQTLIMYKYAGIGLLGLFFVMIYPTSSESIQDGMNLYGAGTVNVFDRAGNSVFTQTVHNQLFDQGEGFIISQTFTDLNEPTLVADNIQIGAICLSVNTISSADEVTGAAVFNSGNGRSSTVPLNCLTDATVTNSSAVVTIGPLTFQASASAEDVTNWVATETIGSIGICQAESTNANVSECTTTLFAVVDTSDVTLGIDETVDITYTFDLTSAGT